MNKEHNQSYTVLTCLLLFPLLFKSADCKFRKMTVLTLLEQYLEDSAEITAPSHSIPAEHNGGTSLEEEEARECKVLCS